MALTNYSELQNAVASWLHRTDLSVQIPDFIYLAEKKITNNIQSRQQEVSTNLTTSAGVASVSLPSDYGSLKNIQISGATNNVLKYIPDETYLSYNSTNQQGIPSHFTIQGNSILLSPVPNSEYTINIVYFQDVPSLSSTNPTNWILSKYPYIYLYGSLIEASVFVNDPEQVSFYQQKLDESLREMWQNNIFESFSGSTLSSVSDYVV